jgi:Leucine-rich repeat (LRR) protein
LIVQQQQIIFLPSNLGETFEDLLVLEVIDSGLCFIDHKTFASLTKVETLNLTNNKLVKITNEPFTELKALESLDLSFNNIESLEAGAFNGLDQLKFLNLSSNKLVELEPQNFKALVNLVTLQIENNKLQIISSNFLSPMKLLTSLDLSNNLCINATHPATTLEQISSIVDEKCVALIDLECESNKNKFCNVKALLIQHPMVVISRINGEAAAMVFQHITELRIKDQTTNFLPHRFAESFSKLRRLVVFQSQLTSLEKNDFVGFDDLKRVEICNNNLTSIDDGFKSLPSKFFKTLIQLKTLKLSNNQLTKLDSDIFYL